MDANGWDERYAASDLVWSSAPNRTVADEVGGLTAGTALDLGAGEGRNALWLAERGWSVTAVDFSAVGLDKARAIARQRRLQLTTVVADVTRYHPKQTYDLVLIAYLQLPWTELQNVLAAAATALTPTGTLLLVAHDLTNLAEGVGGPQDPQSCRPRPGRGRTPRLCGSRRLNGSGARLKSTGRHGTRSTPWSEPAPRQRPPLYRCHGDDHGVAKSLIPNPEESRTRTWRPL